MEHKSVLLEETVDGLAVKPDGIYVDGTLGRGGHSSLLASKLTTGHLYAFDKDEQAIAESTIRLEPYKDVVTIIHDDFRHIKEVLNELDVQEIDGIMLDLGVSSPQFDDPSRGFSYRFDSKLDMRMDQTQRKSAYEIVNQYSIDELTEIFRVYGEERYAYPIAKAIEKKRSIAPIETTFELVDVIKSALPARELNKKGHPAKQVFQALRIEVNDELNALRDVLKEACSMLKPGGRCAVITFHSLEDRIAKTSFKELSTPPYIDPKLPIPASEIKEADYRLITKKPILATENELNDNHRAHSAKLRILERK